MNSKAKSEKEDLMNNEIDKAIQTMGIYGWMGIDRKGLFLNESAMRFFKGTLRQQNKTEAEIDEIIQYIGKVNPPTTMG